MNAVLSVGSEQKLKHTLGFSLAVATAVPPLLRCCRCRGLADAVAVLFRCCGPAATGCAVAITDAVVVRCYLLT